MDVSEDGTVTGSINWLQLWQIEAQTAEAQTQLDQLMEQAGENGWQNTPYQQPPE